LLIYQLDVSLVRQRRRLQRVASALTSQIALCEFLQFTIDQWGKLFESLAVSVAPGEQELG
jgi:hypothetical protein